MQSAIVNWKFHILTLTPTLKFLTVVEAHGRPPQDVSQWHIDYFELKLLKKWPVQEGHSEPPFCLPENRK